MNKPVLRQPLDISMQRSSMSRAPAAEADTRPQLSRCCCQRRRIDRRGLEPVGQESLVIAKLDGHAVFVLLVVACASFLIVARSAGVRGQSHVRLINTSLRSPFSRHPSGMSFRCRVRARRDSNAASTRRPVSSSGGMRPHSSSLSSIADAVAIPAITSSPVPLARSKQPSAADRFSPAPRL